jgi:ADP-ribose pyrophosphatase
MPDQSRLEDVPEHPRILDTTTIHEGKVWNVLTETFEYNGHPITREVMDHPGAVAVLAMDDEERVLLIRQYRHPVRSRDWEIPAGLLDVDGEGPFAAAQRELAEEADLKADRWDVLADFLNSPGGTNEMIRVYLARDVSEVPAFERSEEEADIEVRWVPLDEAVDAVLTRRVQSPSLVIGALAAVAARSRDWATLAAPDTPWDRHPRIGNPPWTLPPEDPAADRPAAD